MTRKENIFEVLEKNDKMITEAVTTPATTTSISETEAKPYSRDFITILSCSLAGLIVLFIIGAIIPLALRYHKKITYNVARVPMYEISS